MGVEQAGTSSNAEGEEGMSRGLEGSGFVGGRCEGENPDNRQCHQRCAGYDAFLHGVSPLGSLSPGKPELTSF